MPEYKILSFDPGMKTFGYCVSTYDESVLNIIDANTYNLEMLYREFDLCKRFYPMVYTKVAILRKIVLKLLMEHKPDYITCEAAFYNPGRPSAFSSLLRFIYTLDEVIYKVCKKSVYKLAPLIVKKVSHSKIGGKATKDDMKVALLENINKGIITSNIDVEYIDEHAVDASLIGYAFTQLWIPIITAKLLPPCIVTYTRGVDKDIERIYKKMEEKHMCCKLNIKKKKRKKKK